MWPLDGTLAQCGGHFLKAPQHMVVQSDDLSNDDVGILPIFYEALHHRTKQCLWESRGAI